jgi:hypothetical protein
MNLLPIMLTNSEPFCGSEFVWYLADLFSIYLFILSFQILMNVFSNHALQTMIVRTRLDLITVLVFNQVLVEVCLNSDYFNTAFQYTLPVHTSNTHSFVWLFRKHHNQLNWIKFICTNTCVMITCEWKAVLKCAMKAKISSHQESIVMKTLFPTHVFRRWK